LWCSAEVGLTRASGGGAEGAWYDLVVVSPNNFFQYVSGPVVALPAMCANHVAFVRRRAGERLKGCRTSGRGFRFRRAAGLWAGRYTPLLPGAVTGSVEMRSIIESTRHLLEGTPPSPLTNAAAPLDPPPIPSYTGPRKWAVIT